MSNEDYILRAQKVMPGGVSSPVRAFKSVGGEPRIIKSANGAFLTDVENKSYIDYCMSFGPMILGHAHPNVVDALKNAVENGTSFGATNDQEIILAERIVRHHPAVEWIRFVNSGTEAVMSAVRLARAHTNRSIIVKFDGTYHGHADPFLVKAGSGLATLGIVDSAGVPREVSGQTIVLELGNTNALDECVEKFGSQIACIIIEGIPANNGLLIQSTEFMHYIQHKAYECGALFILDEVITGFRISLQGATGHYGLKPDIVTFGKIIGGGLPIGAYGGKKELMEFVAPLGSMYQAGTLSGNPLAVTAGNATLDVVEMDPHFYQNLSSLTSTFTEEIYDLCTSNNKEIQIPKIASVFWLVFQKNSISKPSDVQLEAKNFFSNFHNKALKNGIYLPPSAFEVCFLSLAHNTDILNKTIKIFKSILE
jgi:glutamate-1-semialdehyde 2,1-aminomutase